MSSGRVPVWSVLGSSALLHLAIAGCASNPDATATSSPCLGRAEEPLIEGTAQETYLGLAPAQTRAVVALVNGSGETDALCSGIAITPSWVLSAAHCGAISSLAVRVQSGSDAAEYLVPVARVEALPGLDLGLFELDFQSFSSVTSLLDWGISPVATAPTNLGLTVGDAVELAGFGLTETGASAGLRYLVETIVEVDAVSLFVNGFGMTGACDGDSGGPLLARTASGSLMVAGVLSAGAPSCREKDRYLRLDTVRDWVETYAGIYEPLDQECGSISREGRCLYGASLWCEDGLLRAADCAREGKACGWEPAHEGFRCVDPRSDRCAGIDGIGTCRMSAAVTCTAGTLIETACACGACRVVGMTGAPYCVTMQTE